jgi:hypothetical protein
MGSSPIFEMPSLIKTREQPVATRDDIPHLFDLFSDVCGDRVATRHRIMVETAGTGASPHHVSARLTHTGEGVLEV